MANIKVDDAQLQELIANIKQQLGEKSQALIEYGAARAGVYLESVARGEYPPERRPLKQSHTWTPKQRRFWWWVMHNLARDNGVRLPSLVRQKFIGYKAAYTADGRIDIQGFYYRTNGLPRSIASKAFVHQNKVRTIVGSDISYARFVIGDAQTQQHWYHRGNWTPLIDLVRDNLEGAAGEFLSAVVDRFEQNIETR